MFRIRLKAIALISFLTVIGGATWKKALTISLCGLLGFNSLVCSANFSDRPANAAIPPATAESTVMPETIGDIPRIRKPQVDLNLEDSLPADFQVSSQMPFSSGKREILLVSPSTGTEQQYTVNLPGRSFQMYQMKLKNVGAIATSNLPVTARNIVESTQAENIREFEIDFEDNRASEVILADGIRGELLSDRAFIKSPNGEVLETIEISQLSQGDRGGVASSKSVSKPQYPGNHGGGSLLASDANCSNNVGSFLGNFAQDMTTIGNQLALSKVASTRTVGFALSIASAALKNNAKSTQSIQEVTCEAPVQCDERRVSGASEVRSDLFQIPAAIDREVTLEYEFFEIPDTIELNYDGNQLFYDGPKAGLSQQTFRLPDTAEYIGVRLTGNTNPDTRWWYKISCTGTAIAQEENQPCPEHPEFDLNDYVYSDEDRYERKYIYGVYITVDKYHHYVEDETIICSTKKNQKCTVENVFQIMISEKQFVAPFVKKKENPYSPVENCKITALGNPNWLAGAFVRSFENPIITLVNIRNHSIKNYTLEGHAFHPGTVTRTVYKDENGNIRVKTEGDGIGKLRDINQEKGPGIFRELDERLRERMISIITH